MNVYDFQELERQSSHLRARLADDTLDMAKSNAIVGDEFSTFFQRHQGQVLGDVDVEDIDMEMMFKQWCLLVSLPISVWQGAFLWVSERAIRS